MKENVGGADRVARAVAGPALMVMGLTRLADGEIDPLGLLALLGGALLAETAVTRVCPLNEALGIDTARRIRHA